MILLKKKSTKDLVHPEGAPSMEDLPGPKKPGKKPKKERSHGRLSFREIVRSRPFLGGLCVVLALLLAFVVTPLIQLKIAETTTVVVLRQTVPAGAQLSADMLATREMGVTGLPLGAVTSASEAVGKYAAVAGVEGDILTSARLSDTLPGDDPELARLPEGKLAMSATLSDLAQSVSGKLRSGDVIRLYAILDQAASVGAEDLNAVSVPELQYMEVLAVTNSSARDVKSEHERMGEETADSERQIATVTLAVNHQQAAVLAGLEHNAALHAALVVRGDDAAKREALKAQEAYFAVPEEEDPAPMEPQPAEGATDVEAPAVSETEPLADAVGEGGGEV